LLGYGDEYFEIIGITAMEALDSRGNPTLMVEALTRGGGLGKALVPSGASKGAHEALELRDGDPNRFRGKGVLRAVENVNAKIAPAIRGMNSSLQRAIDLKMIELDGTEDKSNLGANAILGVSLAVAKAAADTRGVPLYEYLGGISARTLPVPLMNLINGGKHAGNGLSFQEFMIAPIGFGKFSEALRAGCEIYMALRELLREKYGPSSVNVGDEGGFAPNLKGTREALDALMEAIEGAGMRAGRDVVLALDAAASSFYDGASGMYAVDGELMDGEGLTSFYEELVREYPIFLIEDPLQEEDFDGTAALTKRLRYVQIVGDDLFVTNRERLRRGAEIGSANAILIKLNQIGTLSETMDVISDANGLGYRSVVSHRSGETEDTTIADLAVGLGVGQIKTGAPARGERTAKYNRLLEIEYHLSGSSQYYGRRLAPRRP
jgi:enolase